jgi:hypothetical protein
MLLQTAAAEAARKRQAAKKAREEAALLSSIQQQMAAAKEAAAAKAAEAKAAMEAARKANEEALEAKRRAAKEQQANDERLMIETIRCAAAVAAAVAVAMIYDAKSRMFACLRVQALPSTGSSLHKLLLLGRSMNPAREAAAATASLLRRTDAYKLTHKQALLQRPRAFCCFLLLSNRYRALSHKRTMLWLATTSLL